jgi:regulator of sigma E protease
MLTVAAFLLALGLLVAIHEYGHYQVARWCGVKVIRFSVGFGKVLARWTPKGSSTEFVLGAFPLGGYVKMLDEREAPVDPAERHLAFNTQPLRSRVAIVAAGPVANLLLAIGLYAAVNWNGLEQAKPILAIPVAGSVAERAGLAGGEVVTQAGLVGDDLQDVVSFEDFRWLVTQGALDSRNLTLMVSDESGGRARKIVLNLSELDVREVDASLFRKVGITSPLTAPVIGQTMPEGAAASAGLREGDVVLKVGTTKILDGQQLREWIRSSVNASNSAGAEWTILRAGAELTLTVLPRPSQENGVMVGRIGAFVGAPPALTVVRYGFLEGLQRGVSRTWEVSILSLKMLGRMAIGEASFRNLSGPLTIADYAGKSASLGLNQYLLFLALISVSLGVMNLLPLPVLDGGHLMYYLWEGLTGRAVSEAWMERLQRGGVMLLAAMMSIAIFNDLSRLLG